MARGKKNLTLDEQLAKVTAEIETLENSLKEKKAEKKDLENKLHQARLSELDQLIQDKGLSFDDIKQMLESKDKE